MYETVKKVGKYEICRMIGTRGKYRVPVAAGKHFTKYYLFRSVKAAEQFIRENLEEYGYVM